MQIKAGGAPRQQFLNISVVLCIQKVLGKCLESA